MARVKQTARKGPAKKKSGDKRRSPRIAAQNELEDYDDEPAPEAEDVDYRQTAKQTRSDNAREKRDDAEQTAAADDAGGRGTKYWKRLLVKRDHSGGPLEVYLGRRRRSRARKGRMALPCDPFKSQGYGNYEEGDDHPACVEQQYRDAGFDWDDPASRAMIDKLAMVCKEIDHSVPVPGKHMLVHWVEWVLWKASKASAARRVKLRGAAKTVIGLATDSYAAMSAIAAEQGPPGFCEGCAMDAAGLLENHADVEEITLGGLVVTRDGSGGLCGNQNNYFTAPSY